MLSVLGLSWPVIISFNLLFLLGTLFDLLFSPKRKQIHAVRNIQEEMERGIRYQVKIQFHNESDHSYRFQLIDGIPQTFQKRFPIKGMVEKGSSTTVTYETFAPVRGKYHLETIYVRYSSLLGLWEKQTFIQQQDEVKVIPDLTDTKRYLENAQKFLLYEGTKIRKQKSGAGEFSRIRNYVVGDDPRKINWRQTAKLQEVMANEFEPEHGKYITILIDCGRMMGAELKKGNRLEKALEASLTVAAAALKNDDYVSVLAFSKDVKVYVPPAKGMDQLQKILQAVYDLEVDSIESNFSAVLNYLQSIQKKRSLMLMFSDVHTFLHEESTLLYLKRLRQRHLFLMIGVEDQELLTTTRLNSKTVQSAMIKSIAQQQVQYKKREKVKWEAQGLIMIEAKEDRLASEAVSRYIHIMNQGLL
ncbi:DUF58 domain-containing protein [Ornithinibacillus sp. L9]|uniref:DUF58 domain-containing protein n=2 Tax=Ornithinibacillus caprae TaxID=2678566 RepID=A0A6N8FGK8_9BACI|nr:DUF58 domain-containing protein [Ornithinibacillus caprae]